MKKSENNSISINKYLKVVLFVLSLCFFVSIFVLIFLQAKNIIFPTLKNTFSWTIIISLDVLFLLQSFLFLKAIFLEKYLKPSISVFLIIVSFMAFIPQANITLITLLPIFLSLYTFDKKFVFPVTIANSLLYVISEVVRNYITLLDTPSLGEKIAANSEEILRNALFGMTIKATISIIVFIAVIIPLFVYLINSIQRLKFGIEEKDKANNEILEFCSTTMAYHDRYLQVHINGVKEISKIILNNLLEEGIITEKFYRDVVFSVQFHDIGKIYINPNILDKPGKLTTEEFLLVKEHPLKGAELFDQLPSNVLEKKQREICRNIILQHHEKLDCTGYPFGLGGNDISFEAQIVSVADIVDALLSWRPYKYPMSWEKFVDIIKVENKDKLNQKLCDIVINNKDRILEISNINNLDLKEIFNLQNDDILRKDSA